MAATSASAPALPAAEGAAAADSASAASPDVSNSVFDASDPQLAAGGRYNKQLNTALDLLQEMLTPTSKCNWKLASSKKGVEVFTGAAPDGNIKALTAKTHSRINASPRVVYEVLTHPGYRLKVDSMLKSEERVELLDFQSYVAHICYKGMWPVSARDFCVIFNWKLAPDGSIWVTTCSVEHEKVPPKKKKIIRAQMLVAGYLLTPCVDKDGNVVATDLMSVSCVDMGGKMTKKIRDLANKIKARSATATLKKICEGKLPKEEVAAYEKYDSFQAQLAARKPSGSPDGTRVAATDVAIEESEDAMALAAAAGKREAEEAPASASAPASAADASAAAASASAEPEADTDAAKA